MAGVDSRGRLMFHGRVRGFLSVVRLTFYPATRVTTYDEATALIVDKDEDAEWDGNEPPSDSVEEKGKDREIKISVYGQTMAFNLLDCVRTRDESKQSYRVVNATYLQKS